MQTWCKEMTHWKRSWCWERLKAGGDGDDRGWDGWIASPTQWTWVWASSRSYWWTGKTGVLQSMGSQRVRHEWVTKLDWRHECEAETEWEEPIALHTHTHTHTHTILWKVEEESVLQRDGIFLTIPTGNMVIWEVKPNLVSQYRIRLQCRRPRIYPWVGKIPWRREWQPTPGFLPGDSPWTEKPSGL